MDYFLDQFEEHNYETVLAVSLNSGHPVRHVLARIRERNLSYRPLELKEPIKVKKESKADLVKQIEKLLATNFKGLDKLVLDDLVSLRNALQK